MNQFEASIILWIQENLRVPWLDGVWLFITHLGDEGILWIAMGLTMLFWKKTRPIGFTMLLALIFDLLIINITLKDLVARPRPFVVNEAIRPLITDVSAFKSFPSGHSGGAFAAMFALYWWVPKKVGIPALILATLVALSRLYVGVHHPTDILAGCLVGFVCGALAYYLVQYMRKKISKADRKHILK